MAAIASAPKLSAAPVESTDTVLGADGQPIRELEASINSLREQTRVPVHQMWLPPLEPVPVEELVRCLRRKPWYQDYGHTPDCCSRLVSRTGLSSTRNACTRWTSPRATVPSSANRVPVRQPL